MQLKELGEWNAPTALDRKLLALEAKVAKMSKKNHNEDNTTASNKKAHRNKRKKDPENNKINPIKKWIKDQKPPPKNNPHQTRICKIGGQARTYHWCSTETGGHCGGRWVMHKPDQCLPRDEWRKALEEKKKRIPKKEHQDTTPTVDKKKLRVAEALASIIAEPSDDSDA